MFLIRSAVGSDVDEIYGFDHIAQHDKHRRAFIERSVYTDQCCVIEANQQIIGYAVLAYSFYEQGFVSMVYIHPGHRRQGAGMMLMKHLESVCQTPKIFTSTNLSNLAMQALLAKLGYALSGVIHHLDEDDPELVFVKYIRQSAKPTADST